MRKASGKNSPRCRRPLLGALSLLGVGLVALACGDARDVAPAPEPASAADESPAQGRWRKARPPGADTDGDLLERLAALGYVAGSQKPRGRGVTVYDADRAQSGLNFYTSGHGPEALLVDMQGRELHRWHYAYEDAWPGRPAPTGIERADWWRRAHLFGNGDVLAVFDHLGIIKLDAGSNLLWANGDVRAHHDLAVTERGDIYVLASEHHVLPRISEHGPIHEDFIVVLGPDGREKTRVSLLESYGRSDFANHLRKMSRSREGDLFHTNSLELLDGRLASRDPAFAAGNVMTSMCYLHSIAVVDMARQEVVWARKGAFRFQHDPTITSRGGLLLFDNLGLRDQSRVLEFDPVTDRPLWDYGSGLDRPIFSRTCGTAARLANGNTLITESDAGRAVEVTDAGDVVWEFWNPERAGAEDELIATLFELVRLPEDAARGWLPEAPEPRAP